MKKETLTHFSFLVSLFIFISLFKGWFHLSFLTFWVGGILGTILPDIDHLIYVYFMRPEELTSRRVAHMVSKRDIWGTLNLLADTRTERTKLIFHTINFQVIFLALAFLVTTSSGSYMGRGIVVAFLLHLVVDQAIDIAETGGLVNWFEGFPLRINPEKTKTYWSISLLLLLIFSFLL